MWVNFLLCPLSSINGAVEVLYDLEFLIRLRTFQKGKWKIPHETKDLKGAPDGFEPDTHDQ